MEEGTRSKKTVFVGGINDDVDEALLLETFSTFGDVIEVQLPPATNQNQHQQISEAKHRGFAFVTYSSADDAQDAIDNMDLNELRGRVIKVNLARPTKGLSQPNNRAIWESEEWLKQYAKPLSESGGRTLQSHSSVPRSESQEPVEQQQDGQDEAMEE